MTNTDKTATWPGWETVRLIGRGSFGAVYEIERDVLGEKEKAALKVISIPQSDSDISEMYSDGYDDESITSTFKEHLKSIVAEYSLMRKLNGSANVVNCDDVRYVQHDDGFGWDIYIKMELLTPLTSALPAEISEEQVIKIGKDLCHALVQCKQFGIIHRDIKPQNIFVSPLGDYKLGDFGIAKTVEKTSGGTKIGTYKYMAPEVYNSQPYGAGADIYSLGLVLYWLLNERRMPFLPLPPEKLRAGLEEQARLRRFNGEPIPAPAHGSKELKRIVLKAVAFDPKERYLSAGDMLSELEMLGGIAPLALSGGLKNGKESTQVGISGSCENEATESAVNQNAQQEEDKTVDVLHTLPSEFLNQIQNEEETVSVFSTSEKEREQPHSTDMPPKNKKGLYLGLIAMAAVLLVALIAFLQKQVVNPTLQTNLFSQKNTTEAVETSEADPQIIQVSVSEYHAIGLRSDGTVVSAGRTAFGECNVYEWKDVVEVHALDGVTIGLRSDGSLLIAGRSGTMWQEASEWQEVEKVYCTDIEDGRSKPTLLGLTSDGRVLSSGFEAADTGDTPISGWENITELYLNHCGIVGLKSDGTIYSGFNSFDALERNNRIAELTTIVHSCHSWRDIQKVALVDRFHPCAIGLKRNGDLVVAGSSDYQEAVSDWTDIVDIAGSSDYDYIFGLRRDGSLVCNDPWFEEYFADWNDIVGIDCNKQYLIIQRAEGTAWVGFIGDISSFSATVNDCASIDVSSRTIIWVTKSGEVGIINKDKVVDFSEIDNW